MRLLLESFIEWWDRKYSQRDSEWQIIAEANYGVIVADECEVVRVDVRLIQEGINPDNVLGTPLILATGHNKLDMFVCTVWPGSKLMCDVDKLRKAQRRS